MSLINEALKKAQRVHHARAEAAASGEPNGPVVKRGRPKSAWSMLMLGVGAVVLVVVSMVITAVWMARAPTPSAPAAKAAPAATPPAAASTAETPALILPPLASTPSSSQVVVPPPVTAPAPAAAAPAAALAAQPPATPPATASSLTPASPPDAALTTTAPGPKPGAKPDERVHQFIDTLKVTGIRSSGTESKVLMNDRVYRINDLVERTLGLRLTKVENDNLTFTDGNGVTYVKFF